MIENNGLSDKRLIKGLADRLKKVLNPFIYIPANPAKYYILQTDIPRSESVNLGFSILGIGKDLGIINFTGYFKGDTFYGLNSGKSLIRRFGSNSSSENIQIYIESDTNILQLSVEIFLYGSDNKNHCSNIIPTSVNPNGYQIKTVDGDPTSYRFSDLSSEDAERVKFGLVVQYIGDDTNDYKFGYFYKKTYPGLEVVNTDISEEDPKFEIIEGSNTIDTYNQENDYILDPSGDIVFELDLGEANESTGIITINENTQFILENGITHKYINYSELKSIFNIKLIDETDIDITDIEENPYVVTIEIEYSGPIWILKNVQPEIEAPLDYKGIKSSLEALQSVENPKKGDFWTISDGTISSEYFYTGSSWEYMGDIFSSSKYTSAENNGTLSVAVGGIAKNTTVEKILYKDNEKTLQRTVSEVLDMILFPDLQPTLSGNNEITKFLLKSGNLTTVAYGTNVYSLSDFDLNYTSLTISYSKKNNSGSVLEGQIYQGFATLSITHSPNNSKFKANTTYTGTVSWVAGDKYPCTKKGNTPSSGNPSGYALADSKSKTVNITVYKHCLYGLIPENELVDGNITPALILKYGTKKFVSGKGDMIVTMSNSEGISQYPFIAVPAETGQNWSVGTILEGAVDATNAFTENKSVTGINITNNEETYTCDMKVKRLNNSNSATSFTYKITIQ